ncbi:hypothetical protein HZS_4028 [Henneguya salminicola]|nr:hypothetical protein HZS_4028 [Henneguya salminicola]
MEKDKIEIDHLLKEEIRKEALTMVRSIFNSPEQLEKLDIFLAKEVKKEKKLEKMMQTYIKNHVENLKSTIKELRISIVEANCVQNGIVEVHALSNEYKKHEKILEKLMSCSLSGSSITQTLNLLKQIINMNSTIENTKQLLKDMQLLQVHKNLRELENVRDKIFSKHFDKTSSTNIALSAERNLLVKNFEPVSTLSNSLFERILYILKNITTFAEQDPSTLVTTVRIIEREEKVDEYWKNYQRTKDSPILYIPPSRPKAWASYIYSTVSDNIKQKIENIKSNINFDDKLAFTEFLERIRKLVADDISSIQTFAVRCFPPSYQILNRFCALYHAAISETLDNCIQNWKDNLRESDILAVLLFQKDYTGESLFGNKEFDKSVLHTIINSEPLLKPLTIQKLEHAYLTDVCDNLTSKVSRVIGIEKRLLDSDSIPNIVNNKYCTLLSSFYDDFVGLKIKYSRKLSRSMFHGVFKYCVAAFEQFLVLYENLFDSYVTQQLQVEPLPSSNTLGLSNITGLFKSERNLAFHEESPTKYENFVQHCIAIANNCIQIRNAVDILYRVMISEASVKSEELNIRQKNANAAAGEELSNRFININSQIEDFSRKCVFTISNDYLSDLNVSFDEFLGPRWKENATDWSEGFHLSLLSFDELLGFLHASYHSYVMECIDKGLAQKYLKRFLNYKTKYNMEQLSNFGELIFNDGKFLAEFFSKNRDIKLEDTFTYAIIICASIFKNTDKDCALIDVAKIFKMYGDFTSEHAFALLSKRSDLTKDKINETIRGILDGRKAAPENSKTGIFNEIKISSSIF